MKTLVSIAASLTLSLSALAQSDNPFNIEVIASFDEPWAMAFLPDGKILVTEKKGRLAIVGADGELSGATIGVPNVDYGGQGGFGDVALHPDFEENGLIYLSYAEAGIGGTRGAAVARGKFALRDRGGATLSDVEVVWRQYPKVTGYGHYAHRILFDSDGYLWISSGDRQKFTPAQDMQSNIGKIVRLHDDGSIPDDNPFVDYRSTDPNVGSPAGYPEIWSLGHRNPLGIAFDLDGHLWDIEMGPRGGDEINRVVRGGNYGYPIRSNGDHYDGRDMPDHSADDGFLKPAITWNPVISPGDLSVVSGGLFPRWRGNLLAAGLSSTAIVRIELDGENAKEVARYPMGARIRSVRQGPDGAIWVLEDERGESQGRLLRLTPK